MVLPNGLIFPHTLVPLHIFEERYREMLAYALERHRMFCIALQRPGVEQASEYEDFFHVTGLGLIRACVGRDDGTSNLVLQGIARVRLTQFVQQAPFLVAEIAPLPSEVPNVIEAEALGAKVLELCEQIRLKGVQIPASLGEQPSHLSDPEVICDKVASLLVNDPFYKQAILEQPIVTTRLRMLLRHLGEL